MSICNMPVGIAYLASPYALYGIERAFTDTAKLAAKLLLAGVRVYSPVVHCHPIATFGRIDPIDYSVWLPFNETMLAASSVLIVAQMEGWRESRGVAFEVEFFERAGKPIFDLDPKSLLMVRRRDVAVLAGDLAHGKTAAEHGGASA